MTEIRVREATSTDLDALSGLYEQLTGALDEPLPDPPPDPREVLDRILADPARSLLVAELDGRLVGTVDVLIAPNLTHHAQPWALVENVVVAESARRRGVGRALMLRAIELAREAGCYKVNLISGNERTGAHDFYRSLGFEAIGQGFKSYLLAR
ncbi:MAG TPA: GNAT family N-acetyltransferase [Solirubrobacteraceae bacterium]|nr:GNAT family N-acetyltransferase [Solirubrobacteraceae bacterium]